MRLTKRTNLSMRVLMHCGVNQDRLVTKTEIAQACNTSENHLAQVINRLAQLGFLDTRRGRGGGLTLGRPMTEITVGEVFRAMEKEVPIAECFAGDANTCPLVDCCRLREVIQVATESFYAALDPVTLDELVCDNRQLAQILAPTISCGRHSQPLHPVHA